MKHSKRTSLVLLSVIALSGIIVPGMYINKANANVTPQQFSDFADLFANPASVGSTLGTMIGGMDGFQGNILGDIFSLIFSQVRNFDDQEMLPGQNVFVFHANANATTTTRHISQTQQHTVLAPYADNTNNTYRVRITRNVNVDVTFKQQAQIVIILWDNDGSLIQAIRKVLAVVNAGIQYVESNPGATSIPQELIEKASECITWMLVHINDIITGDEQLIFQPSYYWSYNLTGSISETHAWYKNNEVTTTSIATINATSWPSGATSDPYMTYLQTASKSISGSWADTGFLFHLFQLWMQRFQISINMSKLGIMIQNATNGGSVSEDALGNLLEGVDIKFTFTQHHLLGGLLFDDSIVADGKPTVEYITTPYQYTDSSGTKNITVPTASELKYLLTIESSGSDWTPTAPHRDGSSIAWDVQFNNPTLRATPVGMDNLEAAISGSAITMPVTYVKFGFSFTPSFGTLNVPDINGNIVRQVNFGKGVVKLVQEFGDFNGNGSLPVQIQGLSLAIMYFSHIFKFDFSYRNLANPSLYEETDWAETKTGTIDFLDSGDADYFGSIDIAGPDYETNGSTYPAVTSIVPFVMFNLTYSADRAVANDDFSVSQGESAFRQQSLYLGISSAWAFYCVSYPEWNGHELIHDPTFSIFMTLDADVPWAVILLVVTIGALVGGAIMIYLKKQGRF